jgi:uncharacterized protein YjbI with pentapeptide repeats
MSEQQSHTRTTTTAERPAPEGYATWNENWTAQGMPWRTEPEIDDERRRYLAERRAIEPNIEKGMYPFKDIKLDRADVEWLLATHESGGMRGSVDWSDEKQRHRAGLDLRGADLREARLAKLPLARLVAGMLADGDAGVWTPAQPEAGIPNVFTPTSNRIFEAAAHMESIDLREAHLEGAVLSQSSLKGAFLIGAYLEEANLSFVDLDGAWLNGAHCEGATIATSSLLDVAADGAHFERANLRFVKLGGDFSLAHFEDARMEGLRFSEGTLLNGAWLGSEHNDLANLVDVRWNGNSLALVHWVRSPRAVPRGGQETTSGGEALRKGEQSARLLECRNALRANRQLAIELRSQGLNDQADHFAYRAQLLQRHVNRLKRQLVRYLGSFILDLISGYGYKPLRSFLTYALVILAFAGLYLLNAQFAAPHLTWDESLVLSISSFHGRGFFSSDIHLGDTLARLAAGEAITGLLIEITFIATFTQRFFAR